MFAVDWVVRSERVLWAAMAVRRTFRRIKRFAYLGALIGAGVSIKRARERSSPAPLGPPATWPPLQPASEVPVAAVGGLADARPTTKRADDTEPAETESTDDADTATGSADDATDAADTAAANEPMTTPSEPSVAWVDPQEDGSCPVSHPIKANDNSHIYHEPGGRFYDRTRAERCYVDGAAAEADGYRAAKGAGGAGEGES